MTNQVLRIRSCLAVFNLLATVAVLAGCGLDRGTRCTPGAQPCQEKPCGCRGWCRQCGPSTGFHPSVWESWQEGRMAARCCGDDIFDAPAEHDLKGAGPAPLAAPVPEAIPVPKAEGGKAATAPDVVEPSPSRTKPETPVAPLPPAKPSLPKESTPPGQIEPSPSSPLPKKETEKGELPVPSEDKPPLPVKSTDYDESTGSASWR